MITLPTRVAYPLVLGMFIGAGIGFGIAALAHSTAHVAGIVLWCGLVGMFVGGALGIRSEYRARQRRRR